MHGTLLSLGPVGGHFKNWIARQYSDGSCVQSPSSRVTLSTELITLSPHVRAIHEDTAGHRGGLARGASHPLHRHQVQYSTVQYSTVQYSTVQYSTVQSHNIQSIVHSHPPARSVLNLTCAVYSPEVPAAIFWKHNGKVTPLPHNNFLSNNKMLDIKEAERMSKFVLILV